MSTGRLIENGGVLQVPLERLARNRGVMEMKRDVEYQPAVSEELVVSDDVNLGEARKRRFAQKESPRKCEMKRVN